MTLIFVLLAAPAISFYVDPVVFYAPVEIRDTVADRQLAVQSVAYLEFNCEIPYQELYYTELKDTIAARAAIRFLIVDSVRRDSLVDTLFRNFTISSFRDAARREQTFIIQFGVYVNAGTYRYGIEIKSGDRSGNVAGEVDLQNADGLTSGLLLASAISRDTSGGFLSKGGLKVVPRPSHIFKESDDNLFLYYELYNPGKPVIEYSATYVIVDTGGRQIRRITQPIRDTLAVYPVNVGLNIKSLKAGDYIFRTMLRDSSRTDTIAKELAFKIVRQAVPKASYEGLPYYEEIEYFVTNQEYKYFKSLDAGGRRNFLKKFWDAHDYYETAARFEYAGEQFSEGSKAGYRTDRGRIYIKFGPPDEIDESTIELEVSKPYRQWSYYNGARFIFVDIRGTNEYALVWTNARGERSQPTLFNYLPESIRQEVDELKY